MWDLCFNYSSTFYYADRKVSMLKILRQKHLSLSLCPSFTTFLPLSYLSISQTHTLLHEQSHSLSLSLFSLSLTHTHTQQRERKKKSMSRFSLFIKIFLSALLSDTFFFLLAISTFLISFSLPFQLSTCFLLPRKHFVVVVVVVVAAVDVDVFEKKQKKFSLNLLGVWAVIGKKSI